MTQNPDAGTKRCPECGALNRPNLAECWLCRHPFGGGADFVMAEEVSPAPSPLSEWFFAIAAIMLAAVLVLAGIGAALQEPGLGIIYGIVVAPAFIATVVRTQHKRSQTGRATWADGFLTLIVSLSVTVAVIGLLAFAAFAAFFIWCLTAMSRGGFH